MIHQIMLFKLKPDVPAADVERIMMTTRISLLKIPEVLSVKCGKTIDVKSQWPFFIALDFESLDKRAVAQDDPVYLKFTRDVINAYTTERIDLMYEMEPGKNVKFS